MSNRSFFLNDRLYRYLLDTTLREAPVLARLREETATLPAAGMQISPEQGQLMQLLVRLTDARRCVEVGVFTGYSSLSVALALPEDGYLLACDVNAQWTAVAQRYWEEAGVENRIELRLAPALETLDAELAGDGAGSYDFAFIDADKTSYAGYYERCLALLRPGGLIAVDNVLWGGQVADDENTQADTIALRAFNELIHADERIDASLVPIGDGLMLCRKR